MFFLFRQLVLHFIGIFFRLLQFVFRLLQFVFRLLQFGVLRMQINAQRPAKLTKYCDEFLLFLHGKNEEKIKEWVVEKNSSLRAYNEQIVPQEPLSSIDFRGSTAEFECEGGSIREIHSPLENTDLEVRGTVLDTHHFLMKLGRKSKNTNFVKYVQNT